MLAGADRHHQHPQRRRRARRADRRPRARAHGMRDTFWALRWSARRTTAPSTTSTASTSGRSTSTPHWRRRPTGRWPRATSAAARHDLPRVQGRHRHGVAARRRVARSACSSRPTTARASCCGSTACRSARAIPASEVPSPWDQVDALAARHAGGRLDHRHRRHRCAAPAAPVRAAGPARRHGRGADGRLRLARIGRPVLCLRDRQPRPVARARRGRPAADRRRCGWSSTSTSTRCSRPSSRRPRRRS